MTTIEFDGDFDRKVYADWHLPLLSRLFGDRIERRHELYWLTHTHHRQHNGGSDDGLCVAWPSPPARAPIWHLIVERTGAKRFLEVGTAMGYATVLMAEVAGPKAHVDTIESDPEHAGMVFADGGDEEISSHLNRLTRPGGVPSGAIAALYDPLIEVLADLKIALEGGSDSDDLLLSRHREAYVRIVSDTLDASIG